MPDYPDISYLKGSYCTACVHSACLPIQAHRVYSSLYTLCILQVSTSVYNCSCPVPSHREDTEACTESALPGDPVSMPYTLAESLLQLLSPYKIKSKESMLPHPWSMWVFPRGQAGPGRTKPGMFSLDLWRLFWKCANLSLLFRQPHKYTFEKRMCLQGGLNLFLFHYRSNFLLFY